MALYDAKAFFSGRPGRAVIWLLAVLAAWAVLGVPHGVAEAASRRKPERPAPDHARHRVMEHMPAVAGEDFEREIVTALAALGDRRAGTPGGEAAADFVFDFFSSLGIGEVGRHAYQLPFLGHGPTRINLAGTDRFAPLLPTDLNALTPGAVPPEGIGGRAVYGGKGDFASLSGREISGQIVLMELDSGKNWINAAQLGAKALIYIDRGVDGGPSTAGFYRDKFELTPIKFPRFYMRAQEARALFGDFDAPDFAAPEVLLTAAARWEQAIAENIHVFIPGSDPNLAHEVILVEAAYDTGAFVPGRAPGADQAASLAALLRLALELRDAPPARSVLLAATSGQGRDQAGMRELITALRVKGRDLRGVVRELKEGIERDTAAKEALQAALEAEGAGNILVSPAVSQWLITGLKDAVDSLTTRLMRLRLEVEGAQESLETTRLAEERRVLRRLVWLEDFSTVTPEERQVLLGVIPAAMDRLGESIKSAEEQLRCVQSARDLRRQVGDKDILAAVSLYLSSRGNGVGGFCEGFTYELKPEVNISQAYGQIGRFLSDSAATIESEMGLSRTGEPFYRDALRQSRLHPWQSYLVDKPKLGGEVSAIAGILGLTLATVNDSRGLWGTPDDIPEHVDFAFLSRQSRFATRLLADVCSKPFDAGDRRPRNVLASLTGRANFIRQGELFPERPAPGTVFLVYQGKSRFYAMADAKGIFRVNGLSSSKYVLDKAIIEGFRFDPDTGEAVWAVDKKQTGKDAYRVKMSRDAMETDLIMFGCDQSTLFSALDPRTFRYFTKIELLDGRREAPPMRSWFSRLDTLDSTLLTLFLEPGTPYKLILSDTVLARKMILLNASPKDPLGTGYSVDQWPILPVTEMAAARDMWDLLAPRIQNLEEHGIFNERIRELEHAGVAQLKAGEEALAGQSYDAFVSAARSSWALATRVYNDVEKTQKDVLLGVLFYIALFVPFAYCLERVIFCYADIHKRILGFCGILAAVIAVVYHVHPAFRLTYSPLVVILAFFILGLSFGVAMIIFFRFEREMGDLQKRAMHVKTSEIGGLKAFAAAFVIGVSNLRRRKIRTTLTCLTLIILTFTIMSFTAVKSTRQEGAVKYRDDAPYQGALIKNIGWRSLPPEALATVSDMFASGESVLPLSWYELADKTQPGMSELVSSSGRVTAQGVMGLSTQPGEAARMGRILTGGRWFAPGERMAVILPEGLAKRLDVVPLSPGRDMVRLFGMDFRVVGVFGQNALDGATDLDGETLTPVVFPSEAAMEATEAEKEAMDSGEDVRAMQSRYQHVDGDVTVIIPHDVLMGLGGSLKSISVSPPVGVSGGPDGTDGMDARTLASRLAERFGLAIYAGEQNGTFVYHSSDTLSYAGVPNIIIPLIISVCIVLNTMIGSVYERKREIGVYTAVGLAPTHVSFLFIAEALAFAVISAVLGYLLAQTAAGLLSGTSIWAGMTANYSSLAGVAAMLLVIAVVLLSVIYPSKVAGEIAIPDVNRSWTLPEAIDGVISVHLPFLMRIREQEYAGGFLYDYYKSHQDISHGLFSTDDVQFAFECPWDVPDKGPHPGEIDTAFRELRSCFRLTAMVWLAPFDFGIKERVDILFVPDMKNPGFMEIQVTLRRVAGEAGMWKRLNKGFLDNLRKQLLVWRSLDPENQVAYEENIVAGFAEQKARGA
ncbi:ABC transporter permease [Desulfovibrio sulfodismutans]|uniref:ABC transporter permease n=1 Tax=Desulfolutivibrio sulfodismutans TaxID=63561 RepID=A0A7K3NPD1_9BACT|nr:FtsX-like permease family protein [Desulfolutivibrio sulfodismutans]NDY57665.1 ABC transporter permease [Desulfolutivibrio sulfodismutans]QLA11413.1 FtsX-like permease family protein [Desulfolutivibrio sulfodismutans DSM 3696]